MTKKQLSLHVHAPSPAALRQWEDAVRAAVAAVPAPDGCGACLTEPGRPVPTHQAAADRWNRNMPAGAK